MARRASAGLFGEAVRRGAFPRDVYRAFEMSQSTIHEYDEKRSPDSDFLPGDIELLAEGNACRLLDPRRTPGVIEKLFDDCAMFRWRIAKFEHKGKCWEVPAEDVVNYQFSKDSARLDSDRVKSLRSAIWEFQTPLVISVSEEEAEETRSAVAAVEKEIGGWLRSESEFIAGGEGLNLDSRMGPQSLAGDLVRYMTLVGMEEIERRTAENIVLNPNSGEWVKGMEIVLAEMGFVEYRSKVTRTRGVFEGPGARENRRRYLIHRLAFLRALFGLLETDEITLYRAGKIEAGRTKSPSVFASYTFNLDVAKSFCDFERDSVFKSSYLLKRTVPVGRVFMTYLETRAMNAEYKEAEALVLRAEDDDVPC